MTADATVVTPSVPGRDTMLARCMRGVAGQTTPPEAHLICVDHALTGHGARIRNQLIGAARTTWIACCDDDDWFLPHHVETLLAAAAWNVDVVVALYVLEGGGRLPDEHSCDPAMLDGRNWVHPSSILLRRDAVLAVGGFPDPQPPLWDDWALLRNLLHAGAKFACVHEVTNVKGVHDGCICGPRPGEAT